MELSITGKVIDILDEMNGEGRNGPWRKRDFILETQDNYPKTICMTQWGDQIDNSQVQKGDVIKAHIDIQSREYNGRWYTDVKAWRVEKDGGSSGSEGSGENSSMGPGFTEENRGGSGSAGQPKNEITSSKNSGGDPFNINEDIDDDLPF